MNQAKEMKTEQAELSLGKDWRVWRFGTKEACARTILLSGKPSNYAAVTAGDAILLTTTDGSKATGVRRIYLKREEKGCVRLYFDRAVDFKKAHAIPKLKAGAGADEIRDLECDFLDKLLKDEGFKSFEDLPCFDSKDKENQRFVRDLLQLAVKDDLLGPANGAYEEIVGMSVRDRYMVGRLAPRVLFNPALSPTDQAAEQNAADPEDEAEEMTEIEPKENTAHLSRSDSTAASPAEDEVDPDVTESMNASLAPSSCGFTFCIDAKLKEVECEASWGRYIRDTSQTAVDADGKPKRCWRRVPAGGTITIAVKEGKLPARLIDKENPDIHIHGEVSRVLPTGSRLVTLFLVNAQEETRTNRDAKWIFQPEMRVYDKEGEAIFLRRPLNASIDGDKERDSLDMIYRRQVEFATGHGISVHAKASKVDPERATEIRTVVMPEYEVPVTEIPGNRLEDRITMQSLQNEGVFDMRRLAGMSADDLAHTLSRLIDDYASWLTDLRERAEDADVAALYAEAAEAAISRGDEVLKRLREGVQTLKKDEKALEAFRFANTVMADQRVHSIYALARRRKECCQPNDFDVPKNHSWRPFQLAFILLSIPSLADPTHDDRTSSVAAIADLLWFPTGGGKTEAYLGVAAFAMAIRRLDPRKGGLDGSRGLTVIMRYTLRLLTIQQFQRAAALICAMEVERRKNPDVWGKTPFTLGLWVGNRVTPGTTEKSHEAIENVRNGRNNTGSSPAQLTTCPWCGSEIAAWREIDVDRDTRRTRIYCGDENGECPFCRNDFEPDGLPVLVVDQEIYHRPPSMLIATVDKFAAMAWRGEVKTLFGHVESECPRHGFILPDDDECKGRHTRKRALPATAMRPALALRPPDLIIQDEFHLISGPLGTMVGLYETAVDELCSWQLDGKTVRPKIIASTATVRKAAEQVNNVFLRKVAIFPQHGLDVADNFFSVQRSTEILPGRKYFGICAPGASRPATMIRVYVALLTGAQSLFNSFGALADPYMTLVGYFNSLRELGAMRRLSEDDVQTRSYRVVMEKYLERPGLCQRKVRNVDELTSRVSNRDVPQKLDRLEIKFKKESEWKKDDVRAIDVVLATNMLSVGVDVNRLGLMVVNGQPKNTAEYIQSTSRVGRAFPGLVCTVLAWSRPRDYSHYETFEYYHRTFYKHVEAQSVTPFAARAIDHGLTGVMVSALRQKDHELNPNEGAGKLTGTGRPSVGEVLEVVSRRAEHVTENQETKKNVENAVKSRCDKWIKETKVGGRRLGYDRMKRSGEVVNLLKHPGAAPWDDFTVPTSMREVEADVRLIMDSRRGTDEDKPWMFGKANGDNGKEA